MNTHNLTINFGKHNGQLFTRLPVSYLRWMINENSPMADIAKEEFKRRGDTMPKVELSGHAIDRASLKVRKIWHESRDKDEGIYSWLQKITLEALEKGKKTKIETFEYMGMKLIITQGEEFPSLKTIMVKNK